MAHDVEPTNDGSSHQDYCLICGQPVRLDHEDPDNPRWVHE